MNSNLLYQVLEEWSVCLCIGILFFLPFVCVCVFVFFFFFLSIRRMLMHPIYMNLV